MFCWSGGCFLPRLWQAVIERWRFTNMAAVAQRIEVERTEKVVHTSAQNGFYGEYVLAERVANAGERMVGPQESTTFDLIFSGTAGERCRLGGGWRGGRSGADGLGGIAIFRNLFWRRRTRF